MNMKNKYKNVRYFESFPHSNLTLISLLIYHNIVRQKGDKLAGKVKMLQDPLFEKVVTQVRDFLNHCFV
jgi:hypothetical protein